jgi:hypothetical protein
MLTEKQKIEISKIASISKAAQAVTECAILNDLEIEAILPMIQALAKKKYLATYINKVNLKG